MPEFAIEYRLSASGDFSRYVAKGAVLNFRALVAELSSALAGKFVLD